MLAKSKRQTWLIVLILLVGVCAVIGAVYLFLFEPDSGALQDHPSNVKFTNDWSESHQQKTKMSATAGKAKDCSTVKRSDWPINVDLECLPIPDDINNHIEKVSITQKKVSVAGVKDVFCQEAKPLLIPDGPYSKESSKASLLLLHGMKFTSQTWVDLKTVQIMALLGHHVIACDLPGYGKTASAATEVDKPKFIEDVIKMFNLVNPVLVSPSMSGSYALPFLAQKSEMLAGYVPVAPIHTDKYKSSYPSISTPTLILYGDQDTSLGYQSYNNLKLLPKSKVVVLEKASHPAYIDQPSKFHKLLHNFVSSVKM